MKKAKNAGYTETLALAIRGAVPYYRDSEAKLRGEKAVETNRFPSAPGVYMILRRVALPESEADYRFKGVNTKSSPLVLYVGRTRDPRPIKERLVDHFGGGLELNFQRSQFRKFLFQVVQDEETVRRILWSPDTLIATVEVPDGDEVIAAVEKLAMQVFQPRFNVARDR